MAGNERYRWRDAPTTGRYSWRDVSRSQYFSKIHLLNSPHQEVYMTGAINLITI